MIYLIRHGQTKANEAGIYYGSTESELTKKGIEQHKCAAEKLKDVDLQKVVCSPRLRCTELAERICGTRCFSYAVDRRIAEMNFGIFEGLSYIEAKNEYPEAWQAWVEDDDFVLKGGDSKNQFKSRIVEFAAEIIKSHKNTTIAIVTHGGVINLLLCILLDLDYENRWRFKIDNGAVVKIDFADDYAYLVME